MHRLPALGAIGAAGLFAASAGRGSGQSGLGTTSHPQHSATGSRGPRTRTALVPQGGVGRAGLQAGPTVASVAGSTSVGSLASVAGSASVGGLASVAGAPSSPVRRTVSLPAPVTAATLAAAAAHTATSGLPDLAMLDLLVTQRGASHGAPPARATSLATGFGAAEVIRPRPVGPHGGGTAMAPPITSPSAFAGREGPVPLLRRPVAADAAGTAAATGMRGYLPAPPPVSFRPAGVGGQTGSQRDIRRTAALSSAAAAAAATATATAGGRSLLEATAHLFDDVPDNVTIRRAPPGTATAGGTMAQDTTPALRVVPGIGSDSDEDPEVEMLQDPRRMERLVNAVVEKIERRVIDELERRGRRHRPGVF